MKHRERFYRDFDSSGRWKSFRVRVETTDLYIRADRDLSEAAEALIRKYRGLIRSHIETQGEFLTSFSPVQRIPGIPAIIDAMYRASEAAEVGPMASVAGAVAEHVGRELRESCREIIIENGGDIWLTLREPAVISVYTGNHYFPGNMGVLINPEMTPCGVCTSSGRIGPSISLGVADAATVMAPCAALADAAATAAGNEVKTENDVEKGVARAMEIGSVSGALVICRDRMAAQGAIELINPRI